MTIPGDTNAYIACQRDGILTGGLLAPTSSECLEPVSIYIRFSPLKASRCLTKTMLPPHHPLHRCPGTSATAQQRPYYPASLPSSTMTTTMTGTTTTAAPEGEVYLAMAAISGALYS